MADTKTHGVKLSLPPPENPPRVALGRLERVVSHRRADPDRGCRGNLVSTDHTVLDHE